MSRDLYPHQPDSSVSPGETLKELMEERAMSTEQLAERTGLSAAVIQGLLDGDEPITGRIASDLAYVLPVPARIWISLETNYQWHREERAVLAAELRARAADHVVEPYDDFACGYTLGLEHAADLLDGDR